MKKAIQEKVSTILNLMKLMNVKVDDLMIYDGSIEQSGKFPLEVFYSDRTHSFDVSHSQEDKRHPLGVIIGDTIYAVSAYCNREQCIEIEMFLRTDWYYDMFEKDFQGPLQGSLPTCEQANELSNHMIAYNQINAFFDFALFDKEYIAVAGMNDSINRQLCYYFKTGKTRQEMSYAYVLPVCRLKK